MRRAIVSAQSCRECDTTEYVITLLESHVSSEMPHTILNSLRNLRKTHARLDMPLCPFASLPMYFSALPEVTYEVTIHAIQGPLLLVGGAVRIVIFVFHFFADWVFAVGY